ncbi:MAG: SPOR domain-containing protein [Proteobacteria bacterium]|nr:SPOR domain-containing protein [Pseudomonadota bacterium]
MKLEKIRAWRLPLIVFVVVVVGIASFLCVHFWSKGHLSEPDILDLSIAQTISETNRHASLQSQIDEPYHYDFFTLLEQPVPDRPLPDFEAEENPAIKAKMRHSLNKLTGKFAIQVFSSQSAHKAQTTVRELNALGYHAVVISDANGWYRVRVDGGVKREQAETLLATIQKKTGLKGVVVAL